MSGDAQLEEKNLPCLKCPSSDALARYDDGHGYCFSCQTYFTKEEMSDEAKDTGGCRARGSREDRRDAAFVTGKYQELKKRGIREETCRKYGYVVGEFKGKTVQAAPYYDDQGELIAQKLRFPNKDFTVLGDGKKLAKTLFGRHLWKSGGRRVVITEGEIDALTVAQAMGLTWPVVSIPNGAAGAVRAVSSNLEWLDSYDEVVIWFDNDEPGRKAAVECAELLTPGKAKIVHVQAKDANEMLQTGEVKSIVNAVWEAKTYRPDGIVSGEEIDLESLIASVPKGLSTPYKGLDEVTGGLRSGELVLFTAGTGVGKSTIVREIGYHLLVHHGQTVGNVFLEENQAKTAQGYIAIHNDVALGRLRAKPDLLSKEQWERSLKETVANGRCYFYSHFGSLESDNLLAKLRYMAVTLKVNWILLDHISIVVSGMDSSKEGERKDIDKLVTRLRQLIEQTGVGVIAIAHLAKAEGKSHEEGGRVTLNDLRGSASLKQLPDTIIALERDQQGDTPDEADVRVLKNREFGMTGVADRVKYNRETGRLLPVATAALSDAF